MKKIITFLSLFLFIGMQAQEKISGVVLDDTKATLVGVSVVVKGTKNGTTTDFDGNFSIDAKMGEVLEFSYMGMKTKQITISQPTISITLDSESNTLDDVVIIGSRSAARTVTESAVPIDIISMKDIASNGAQSNLNQIMNMVAPSFTSNTQTVSDGTDHIDPAQLRGLGPDQVLVLVNGKRRHTSSLVNINGTPGRGAVGTDMNAIPSFAIDKIEVLRDGASAQYGSDAIAGVINLIVKKDTKMVEVAAIAGANFSKGSNDHTGGNDGLNTQFDLNYGTNLGKKGSFINLTASAQFRNATSRAKERTGTIFNAYNSVEERARLAGVDINGMFGNINNVSPAQTTSILDAIHLYAPQVNYFTPAQQSAISSANTIALMQTALNFDTTNNEVAARGLTRSDFNMRVGQSSLQSTQFFVNTAYPLSDKAELYAFGGTSYRTGEAAGFYRKPEEARTYTSMYPNGFLPEIHSAINDISIAAGIRGKLLKNWNYDFSNTFGKNAFDYTVANSSNATLKNSPSTFDAGGLEFSQNTLNFDINRKYDKLNLAFGSEYRSENYKIKAGEPDSYNEYDINGGVVVYNTPATVKATNFFGTSRPGGAQVFPGFRPENVTDESRSNVALYTDLEYDVTEKWMVNGAVRFENYSDFGSTINYKLATRYKVTNNINLRGAASTGFRAPSLHQRYFNSTATITVGGLPSQVGTFTNSSLVAEKLGIPNLKQEESKSASIGFTAKIPSANITITTDAYIINIKDRIVLTDQFSRPSTAGALQAAFDSAGASKAQLFANAIDTDSKGIDFVVSHKINIGAKATLKNDFSATFSQTKAIGSIHSSAILDAAGQSNKYFTESSRIYLEEAVPRTKANLSNTLTVGKFDFFLRNVYFGQVTDPNSADVNGDGVINSEIINGVLQQNEHPVWGAKILTDVSIGMNFSKAGKIVLGANNILDVYPDENLTSLNGSNQFVYSRNVSQFGMNGRFLFARMTYKF